MIYPFFHFFLIREPVFVDISREDWGMDPEVLRLAFAQYPEVKLVVMYHPYGFPGQVSEIRSICDEYGAVLIEDASECLGASAAGKKAGQSGDYGIISFGQDGVIPAGTGSLLLTNDSYSAEKARYWAAGSHVCRPDLISQKNSRSGSPRSLRTVFASRIMKRRHGYEIPVLRAVYQGDGTGQA